MVDGVYWQKGDVIFAERFVHGIERCRGKGTLALESPVEQYLGDIGQGHGLLLAADIPEGIVELLCIDLIDKAAGG